MKMQDVIAMLQKTLPTQTDLFTSTFNVFGMAVGQSNIQVDSDAVGLSVGDAVNIKGVLNGIEVVNMTADGDYVRIETATDHGLCDADVATNPLRFWNVGNVYPANLIRTDGTTAFICEFLTGPALGVGTLYLTTLQGFNGNYIVNEINESGFQVNRLPSQFTEPLVYLSGGIVNTALRVAGAADMERFNAAYTAQQNDDCWLVVTPADNRASRSRDVTTDAVSAFGQAGAYSGPVELRQTHIETLKLYAVIPARMEIAGRSAADLAEEIRWTLYRTIIGNPIATIAKNAYVTATVPVSDGYFAYLSDSTTYTHEFVFERSVIVEDVDTFQGDDPTAPFRELSLQVAPCDHEDLKGG